MLKLWMAEEQDAKRAAHALLEEKLREYGVERPEFDTFPGGKPVLKDGTLHFSLSHSGPFALCALDSAPVGVDIQTVRPRRPALLRRVCAPEELAWLEGRGDLWSAFALLWALKESRVKESGRGLTSPISAISIPLPAKGSVQLDGLWFRSYGGKGWAGAVCGHSPPPDAIIWLDL